MNDFQLSDSSLTSPIQKSYYVGISLKRQTSRRTRCVCNLVVMSYVLLVVLLAKTIIKVHSSIQVFTIRVVSELQSDTISMQCASGKMGKEVKSSQADFENE